MSILSIGIEQGKQLGFAQGKQQGEIKGKYNSILELLHDLGTLSDELLNKLRSESEPERFRLILRKAAKATSIQEFEDFYKTF